MDFRTFHRGTIIKILIRIMGKLIIYATNIGIVPKNLDEIISVAKSQKKLRITEVSSDAYLAGTNPGDLLITEKGNQLYVVKVYDDVLANLSGADKAYVNGLAANYGLKESNVKAVKSRTKYETWCKTATGFEITKSKASKISAMKENSFKNFGERLKAAYMPRKAEGVRIATDGNICVATDHGYVTIDNDYKLVSYPVELTLDFPVFIMPKPFDQLREGDVIARERSYAKVKTIKDNNLTVVGFTGAGSKVYPIKDFLLGQTTVDVVVSMAGNLGGQINPLMLLAMSDDKKMDKMLPFFLLNQNGGALTTNPLAMMALAGDGDFDFKDLLLYSSIGGGQSPFAGLFGGAPAVPAAPVAEAKKDAE